jgi:hypothetical protein
VEGTPQQLMEEGLQARRQDRANVAHVYFVAAAERARQTGEQRVFGRALVSLADNVLHFCPDDSIDPFAARETLARHARQLLGSIHDEEGFARALRVQSSLLPGTAGQELLEESLKICQRIGDIEGALLSLERIGCHLALYGTRDQANSYKRKALDLARVLDKPDHIAECLSSLANGFDGDPHEHRALLLEAQMLYGKTGRKGSQARCLVTCAQLACEESDMGRRLEYLELAAQLAGEAGDTSLRGICLTILIDLHRTLGNAATVSELEQDLKLLPENQIPDELLQSLTKAIESEDGETRFAAVRNAFSAHGKKTPS